MAHWQYLDYAEPLSTARSALPTYVPPLQPDRLPSPSATAALAATLFFVPVVTVAAQPLGWEPQLADPVRPAYVLQYETWAERPLEVPAFQQIDWYQPLSEPARQVARTADYQTLAERPLEIPRSQHTTWYQPLSEPLRPPVLVPLDEPFVPFIPPAPSVSIAWYQPLSEPVRRPHGWLLPLTVEAPVVPWSPPPPVSYWHPALSPAPLPIPVVALLVDMAFSPPFPIPTPPPGAAEDVVQVGLGHPKSFSTRPELGGGSW